MKLAKVRSQNSNVPALVGPLAKKVIYQCNCQLYLVIVPMGCCQSLLARSVTLWYTMVKPEKPLLHSYNLWVYGHGWRILQVRIQRVSDELGYRWMHSSLRFQAAERNLDPDAIIRLHQALKQRPVQRVLASCLALARQIIVLDLRPKLLMIADEDHLLERW
jgi:hypothetical protein